MSDFEQRWFWESSGPKSSRVKYEDSESRTYTYTLKRSQDGTYELKFTGSDHPPTNPSHENNQPK